MRPRWPVLELGNTGPAWTDAEPTFLSHVVGPGFEQICRDWALGAAEVFGELPAEVGSGVVSDPADRTQIQVDVAVFAAARPGEPRRILSLGEAKWGKRLGLRHLQRLQRARDLLAATGYSTAATTLACYSGNGFDSELEERAAMDESVALVDPSRLYQ